MFQLYVASETEQMELGARLASVTPHPFVIYLQGDPGAGKTTFARGFLNGLAEPVRVKSPTYTLIEPYKIEGADYYHMDLYRLADPEELEYLGVRDLPEDAVLLIEWPEHGVGMLPPPDLEIALTYQDQGRLLVFSHKSRSGSEILHILQGVIDLA